MNRFTGMLLLFILLIGSACNSTHEVFIRKQDSRVDYAYIKPDVDFTKYNAIQVRSISVWYPTGSTSDDSSVQKSNLAKAEDLFKQTIIDAMDGKYKVVDKPARDALWIHVEFADLRSLSPGSIIPDEFQRLKFETKPGFITLVAELRDSRSEEVLARIADLGQRQSEGGKGIVDWQAIEADFRYWAQLLREWLDDIHGNT